MTADESTPLIANGDATKQGSPPSLVSRLWSAVNVENRILLAGFLITLSFSFTQVPIFYVFHLMVCDVYYDKHPPFDGVGDRCSLNEIAAVTARQFSFLAMSTSVCGTLNLFITGRVVKKYGPRFALILQTVIPALRVALQVFGVIAGGEAGMLFIQFTQLVTILGGPNGYILVVNIIASEIVEPVRRTEVFGRLQGCLMLGQATGFLTGGMIGNAYSIKTPFEVAFVSFLLAATFAFLALPYISPGSMSDSKIPSKGGISGFLAPLKVLNPQKLRLESGALRKHYGVLFLCCGVFLGVLATGYAPLLIQMYATAVFEFDQGNNGWLMFEFAFVQSIFLIFMFPTIISKGRKWFKSGSPQKEVVNDQPDDTAVLPTSPRQFEAPAGPLDEGEPVALEPAQERTSCEFDLFFLRWSLVVDGALTTIAAFATQRWHIYLAAFLLPFGSGSAPAAKGVITEMCTSSQRADALNALTLVENMARLSTVGLFGFIFALLADAGKAYITFYCNAAIAVLGMGVLLLSRFPPLGSTLIEDASDGTNGQDESESQG